MSGQSSASTRAAAFRLAFVKLASAGLGLAAAATVATLSLAAPRMEDWLYPVAGVAIAGIAWILASRRLVGLATQLLCYGFTALVAAVLVLSEPSLLHGAA